MPRDSVVPEHRVKGDRVLHRRRTHLIPRHTEVRAIDDRFRGDANFVVLRDDDRAENEIGSVFALTVSGLLADLDRAGFVERSADDADRRRTVVAIAAAQRPVVEKWLDGTAAPLARVLEKLQPPERAAFFKAMDLLESELEVDHETP